LSISPEPETYLDKIAEEIKNLFPEESKEMITPKLLQEMADYSNNPFETDDEVNNGFDENEIELVLKTSREVVTKSFKSFLFEPSYSKCFPKVNEQYAPLIAQFFGILMSYFDFLPYTSIFNAFNVCLNLFRPIHLCHTCFPNGNRSYRCFGEHQIPIALDLLKRLSMDECVCTNVAETFILYLKDDVRVQWRYTNTFPFLNQLEINGELLVSYFYDHVHSKEPEGFPREDEIDDGFDEEELNVQFKKLWDDNTKFELPRLLNYFEDYAIANFHPAIEIDVNFISRFFSCLTISPFPQFHLYENNFWEEQ